MNRPNEVSFAEGFAEPSPPKKLSLASEDDYSVNLKASSIEEIRYGFGKILSVCGTSGVSPSEEWVELRVSELAAKEGASE